MTAPADVVAAVVDVLNAWRDDIVQRTAAEVVAQLGAMGATTSTPSRMRLDAYAKRIDRSRRWVTARVAEGLPTDGTGRARRVIVDEADRWIREHCAEPTNAPAAQSNDPELAQVAELAKARASRRRRTA